MRQSYKFDRGAVWRCNRIFCAISIVSLVSTGCSIFGEEKDMEAEPLELQPIEETLDVRQIWSESVGAGTEFLRVALNPSGDGSRVYAASHDGNVSAFNPENGKRFWVTELDLTLSAGPGIGDGLLVVAGYDGDLIAFAYAMWCFLQGRHRQKKKQN